MDGDLKKLRVRFSGVGKRDKGGSQTSTIPPEENTALGRAQMYSGEEYDTAFAATIAAAAYAIVTREEKLAAQKKPIPIEAPTTAPPVQSSIKRGESMKRPTGGSKISRWFSGKEPAEDDDEGPGSLNMIHFAPIICRFYRSETCKPLVTTPQCIIISVNVSVRRPLKPAQRKPKDTTSDQKVQPKMLDSSMSVKKASGSSNKAPDKKGSKKFEQEQVIQKAPSTVRPATSYHARRNGDGTAGVTAIGGTGTNADAWETAKLARIREEYEKMIETLAEWETEKKTELDRKRAKALEEYNQEMTRINKIAGGARSMAEERKYNDDKKIKEKADKIRSTGKLSRTCACF